ncbi:MAG: acyl-CoA reductase [Verrucomicrobiia bacterium]
MSATVEQIKEAIQHTRETRKRVLHRSTDEIIGALAQTARNWIEPASPWRRRAVEQAPASTGFSTQMINEAVTLTFEALTEDAFETLLRREVGDRRQFYGPDLIAHFLAGNVPPPSINSICFGLLLKSANIVKLSAHDPVFPALFVESLREVDAELADCVAVLDWRREETELARAALADADAVIAYGDDDTITELRRLARTDATFLGYGHKLGLALVGREAMTPRALPALAEAATFDASVYDQQGCLSPHAFYVEEGGELSPCEFAAALAGAMAAYQARVPRGQLTVEEAARIAKLRGAYEFRAAADKSVALWAGPASWLVIYEEDPMFTVSCLNRVVFVKPIKHLESAPQFIRPFASNLSTVGITPMNPALSGVNERIETFATELTKLGVNRVCPIGRMQRPPLWWYHDGRPNLAELVR